MVAQLIPGVRTYEMERDDEGHRNYTVVHLVRTTDEANDGPQTVLNTPGLPAIGSTWNFGNDSDLYAFCTPRASVAIHKEREGDPPNTWRVEQLFTSEPLFRCQDTNIEDPLLEPQKISGGFTKYTEEAVTDRFGNILTSSSHELFRGPTVEIDRNRPNVRIEQNVATLGLATFSQAIDNVNDAVLWGLPARTVKLSDVSWERKYFGVCNVYYTRIFTFDINYDTFDRNILDEGTKVLNGHWNTTTGAWTLDNINGSPPDKSNPTHFIRFKDKNGENARVILNGNGEPLTNGAVPVYRDTEFYPQTNFLTFGIPTLL